LLDDEGRSGPSAFGSDEDSIAHFPYFLFEEDTELTNEGRYVSSGLPKKTLKERSY
jgi:hypothetical protein